MRETSEGLTFFQIMIDEFSKALVSNSTNLIEPYLHDGWTMVEPSIGLIDRHMFLTAIQSGRLSHSSMKKEVLRVVKSEHTAVVVSRGKNVGIYEEEEFDTEIFLTTTFTLLNGKWLHLSRHESPVYC